MTPTGPTAHPYMANSAPQLRQELLDAVGVADAEELFVQIPDDHRLSRPLQLPPALGSEVDLSRHLRRTLARNTDCEQALSFLGGGVWQHHVPAICDEIAQRTEFVTSEWGTPASDHGRNQAWFEFASQLGELLELDFVGLPVYSWGCAAGHAIRMAQRITGRAEVLVPATLDRERLAVVRTYCEPIEMASHIAIVAVAVDPASGRLDVADLEAKLSERTAAVYLETPGSLGVIETEVERIAALARGVGAQTILGVDPLSLGVLAPPGQLGVDIAVGSTQPLGVHMNCGGGVGGFIASRDEERYAREYPTLQVSIAPTRAAGERGFAMTLFEQSSYGSRENGKDWTGNSVYLWAVVNAVYMSLMGPQGFAELGELILQRSHYAAARIAELPGVSVRWGGFFKELVVDFNASGRTVSEVNAALRARGVFGGGDLSASHPELGQSALYAVTEVHAQDDLDRLVAALAEATR
ncbi:aminomethyl-transferring glycine dehydrogenase subunit GcvPA [Conexibacter sp. CPCC 206217]|uniref:aminomethyl-transferring glycine dehydrogenase subunit GcvPA n=1 Tax=Conexibacter sp. CPCC 206217 TaxID=3064574 RepID=UPI00271DA90B|nr:aminomethyl-transferring glycine dehydrogenase subunit GcvPA [Conexibacter sp. CPCC 206217]MDO8209033.1 aminomethyl-transferring glycine dehydrogenase subunit GcvPA [Conexibacter sp. CPCC 206217]